MPARIPFSRTRPTRCWAFAVAIGVACFAPDAGAWCRNTTCQSADCPRDQDNCKTTGHPLAWPTLCAGFSLQEDGTVNLPFDTTRGAIEAAFVTWSALGCDGGPASIAFSELAEAACHVVQFNPNGANANIILFHDTKWPHPDVADALAKTTVTFDANTGDILDADMEINSAYNDLTTGTDHVAYDLQSVVTHEIGHFIGLDHSLEADAVMNASYDEGTLRRTLAADDVAGACAAYPPDRAGRCDPSPRGGFSPQCGDGAAEAESKGCSAGERGEPGSVGAIVLLAGGAILVEARRRSRGGKA